MTLAIAFDFLLLAALWGSSFLFMRVGSEAFGPLPTAALRVGVAVLVLLPPLLWHGLGRQLLRNLRAVGLIGIINSGLPFVFFSYALLSITTGLSAILNATVPLFGALVAWVWLRDRPTVSQAVGLLLGFVGVALLAGDNAGLRPGATVIAGLLASGACLGATLCYAVAASATRKYLDGLPPLVTATGSLVGATLALALPAAAAWPDRMPGWQAWAAVVLAGVLCTGLAYLLYFRLIDRAGPVQALTVTYLIPVFALLYGSVLLAEPITLWMIGCGLVILCGTALSTGLLRLPARAPRTPP